MLSKQSHVSIQELQYDSLKRQNSISNQQGGDSTITKLDCLTYLGSLRFVRKWLGNKYNKLISIILRNQRNIDYSLTTGRASNI